MPLQSQTSYYLVSLFAALRELPTEDCERELEARCTDPELKQQLRTLLGDDRKARAQGLAAGILLDGRYELEQRLGEGASASVWSAYDQKLQRKAELKIFDRGRCAEVDLERALQEARHASHVASDHVVRIRNIAWCQSTRLPYLDMEPCAEQVGETWQHAESMAQATPRDQAEVLRWLIEAAHGMQAAHDCGVFHCDLKPHNILIAPSRRAIVADFGLAVRARTSSDADGSPCAATWIAGGTPSYMAPELIDGLLSKQAIEPREPGAAPHPLAYADVYALGAVLYHMLASEPPYVTNRGAADPLLELLCRIRSEAPRPLGEVAALRGITLPCGVARVVERAMARQPQRRHTSAAAFADELSRCLARMQSGQRTRARLRGVFRFASASVAALCTLFGQHAAVGLDGAETTTPPAMLRADVDVQRPLALAQEEDSAERVSPVPLLIAAVAPTAPRAIAATRPSPAVHAAIPRRAPPTSAASGSRSLGTLKPAQHSHSSDGRGAASEALIDVPEAQAEPPQACAVAAAPARHLPRTQPATPPAAATASVKPIRAGFGDAQQVLAFVRRATRKPDQLVKVVHRGQRTPAYCLLESDQRGVYTCLHQAFVVGAIASSLRSMHRHSELQREWTADDRGVVTRACETAGAAGSYIKQRFCEQPPSTPLTVSLPEDRNALAMGTASATGAWP